MTTRFDVLDIWVDGVTRQTALERIGEFLDADSGLHTVFAANPEKTFSVPADPFLHEMFRSADLIIPDGIGMVLAVRLLYGQRLERVPGCELMLDICGLAARRGAGIFLYGAREEVSLTAAKNLLERFPELVVAGRANGYLKPEENDDLIARINASGASVLFLALGSPRQERWIAQNKDRLPNIRVCQGIGGTLDVVAGITKRAPRAFRNCGLEWLYRLLSEPTRAKRQAVLPVFAWRVMLERLSPRSNTISKRGGQ